MFNKVLGAVADKFLPKTQDWLRGVIRFQVGEMRRPHEGGVSYLDHFLKTYQAPGRIALEIKKHLLIDFAKHLKPERTGDLQLEVHYYPPPMPGLSVGLYLVEGDHVYDAVYERFNLDFAPAPADLIPLPYTPLTPPEGLAKQAPTQQKSQPKQQLQSQARPEPKYNKR